MTDISVHETTLVGVSHQGNAIELTLDGVLVAGARKRASVTFEGVRSVFRESIPVDIVYMEEQDGEILALHTDAGRVPLVFEWNVFIAKRQYAVAYNIFATDVVLRAALADLVLLTGTTGTGTGSGEKSA